jgi:ribonuclease HII
VETPSLERERTLWADGYRFVAGIDEVGRGPLAGPVVAAVVVFPPGCGHIDGLRDSKTLSARQRDRVALAVKKAALAWAIGAASVREVDRRNILRATALAMRRAILRLPKKPDKCLIDGGPMPELRFEHEAIVKGDAHCQSIAAASVLAKCVRDGLMVKLARRYPDFGWDLNKGYATIEHLAAIEALGTTAHHRKSFAPVGQLTLF